MDPEKHFALRSEGFIVHLAFSGLCVIDSERFSVVLFNERQFFSRSEQIH